ncbi:hypothetical protein TYRP_013192 [Tyrophagus putrescentiae]|nr:hypothetical protein TYRP_013192 [Tyrophagus putrescentiae]
MACSGSVSGGRLLAIGVTRVHLLMHANANTSEEPNKGGYVLFGNELRAVTRRVSVSSYLSINTTASLMPQLPQRLLKMSLTCAVIHPSSAVIDQCW